MHTIQTDPVTRLRELAREAQAYQLERGWSDAETCREISNLGSTKTYKRILDDDDDLAQLNIEVQLSNYEAAAEFIRARRASERPVEAEYDDFQNVSDSLAAVAGALQEPGIARLVIIKGETGTGKDTVKRALLKRWKKAIVHLEADELWRESLNTPLAEMIKALGVRREGEGAEKFKMPLYPAGRQELLLEELNKRKLVILVNEAHRMGPRGLNLITTIINKSPAVVVLLCIPALITRLFSNAYEEAIQLIGNRLSEGVTLPTPQPNEIAVLLERRGLTFSDGETQNLATKALATEAPSYGNWAFILQFAREARRTNKGKGKITAEQFAAIIARCRAKRFTNQRRAA